MKKKKNKTNKLQKCSVCVDEWYAKKCAVARSIHHQGVRDDQVDAKPARYGVEDESEKKKEEKRRIFDSGNFWGRKCVRSGQLQCRATITTVFVSRNTYTHTRAHIHTDRCTPMALTA